MITKFKLFENQSKNKYWKILIDDYFLAKLDKLGIPESVKDDIYDHYCDYEKNEIKFVMVGKEMYEGNIDWYWDFNQRPKENFYADEFLSKEKFEYQGVVELTQDEIDEWILKNDAKKYNL